MVAIEAIERKLLALPLRDRIFLAESLLASMPPLEQEMTEIQEMADVRQRLKPDRSAHYPMRSSGERSRPTSNNAGRGSSLDPHY